MPAWAWIIDPSLKFVNVSYTADLSTDHNGKTRRLIESDWYRESFPHVEIMKGENKKTSFQTTQGGARFSTSMFGSVTGKGADIIIFDDALNPQKAQSDTERTKTIKAFDETFQSRLNNPTIGLFLVVEQRLHTEDLTGHILDTRPDRYKQYSFPATDEYEITPSEYKERYSKVKGYESKYLFPERFTPQFLEDQAVNLGSYGYAGQYGQAPSPLEGGIIKKDWFNVTGLADFQSISKGITWNFFLDTAYTTKSTNDPTAIICAGVRQNKLFIKKVSVFRLELPELITKIKEYVKDNGYTGNSRIYIEPKASGKSIVQMLRRQTGLNVLESKPPDVDKVTRAFAITPHIENGRVYLCDGGWTDNFLDECATFPNGKHDDQVDVLVMACDKLNVSAMMRG
jgi:predicted phage terminase large subunit-like protein